MEGFSPWHWLIIIFLMLIWSYPLSVLCRRTGKSPGWAGSPERSACSSRAALVHPVAGVDVLERVSPPKS